MVKKQAQFVVLMILLAALPATSQAQDVNTVIQNVIKAMGSENLRTIRFSGSGSSYTSGKNAVYIKSYTRDIDLNSSVSHISMVCEAGTPSTDSKESSSITADAPWSVQYELWTNPWEFVREAVANKATVSAQTEFAQKYTVITFYIQKKYKISGFINDRNLIEKIQTWIDPDNTLVETTYREYQDFDGLKVPTMIIENRGDDLSLIVIVNDVKTNVPLG